MPYFEFRQNNSFGHFEHDPHLGIGHCVYVEGDNADDANMRAKEIGLYFNGCDLGIDCPCCGDRWSEAWGLGTPDPRRWEEEDGPPPTGAWGMNSYVHHKDWSFDTYDENGLKVLHTTKKEGE